MIRKAVDASLGERDLLISFDWLQDLHSCSAFNHEIRF